jgi:hypothetical protein
MLSRPLVDWLWPCLDRTDVGKSMNQVRRARGLLSAIASKI